MVEPANGAAAVRLAQEVRVKRGNVVAEEGYFHLYYRCEELEEVDGRSATKVDWN